jgi:hypothetical protein
MELTLSKLRENIYKVFDQVLETGVPVFIRRKGKKIKISIEETRDKFSKFEHLEKRPIINGDPDDIVHLDWSEYWKGGEDLS